MLLMTWVLVGCGRSRYSQFGGYAQGGTWSVKANLKGVKEKPKAIQQHIESILYEIDTTLSGYNKASQLSRINAGEEVQPSAMFREVLEAAERFFVETDGAVDCSAGELFDIWGFGFRTDSLPSDAQIKETLANSGKAVWCSIPNDLPPPARGRGPSVDGRGLSPEDSLF